MKYNFKKNVPGEVLKILCTEENSICKLKYDKGTHNLFPRERSKKLNECNKYKLDYKYVLENEKSFFQIEITDQLNKNCILNTSSITYYNIAPFIFEKIECLILLFFNNSIIFIKFLLEVNSGSVTTRGFCIP